MDGWVGGGGGEGHMVLTNLRREAEKKNHRRKR